MPSYLQLWLFLVFLALKTLPVKLSLEFCHLGKIQALARKKSPQMLQNVHQLDPRLDTVRSSTTSAVIGQFFKAGFNLLIQWKSYFNDGEHSSNVAAVFQNRWRKSEAGSGCGPRWLVLCKNLRTFQEWSVLSSTVWGAWKNGLI